MCLYWAVLANKTEKIFAQLVYDEQTKQGEYLWILNKGICLAKLIELESESDIFL